MVWQITTVQVFANNLQLKTFNIFSVALRLWGYLQQWLCESYALFYALSFNNNYLKHENNTCLVMENSAQIINFQVNIQKK